MFHVDYTDDNVLIMPNGEKIHMKKKKKEELKK